MRLEIRAIAISCVLGQAALIAFASAAQAAAPSVEQALGLTPVQKNIDYDQPTAAEAKNCTVKAEKIGGTTGWVVRDAAGNTLRQFIDSNGDNVVDTWCYFHGGLEVYRDLDTDFNGKADEHRWLNTAGSRWAIDKNEDGKIDTWKTISAEEVTAELVTAMAQADTARFQSLLPSPAELARLGLGANKNRQVEEKLDGAAARFEQVAKQQKSIGRDTRWLDFSAMQPGIVPAGTDGSTRDLTVYENAAAMVETSGKQHLLYVGTLVETEDGWRLLDVPSLASGTQQAEVAREGFFYQASIHRGGDAGQTAGVQPSAAAQKLFEELEKLDAEASAATTEAVSSRVNNRRADVLEQLIEQAGSAADRATWVRQFADTVSGAVQTGGFPEGVGRLEKMAERLGKTADQADLAAYVKYRFLLASYTRQIQDPNADYPKIQEAWLATLQRFIDEYPQSDDTADAMLQLAMAEEFSGEEEKAQQWYDRILKQFASSDVAKKAAGARRRLECVGKSVELSGRTLRGATVDLARYKGRIVLVQYWATWCEPCKDDHETLKALVSKYGNDGFSVLGVNLDSDVEAIKEYMKESRLPWHNLYERGGLESRYALEMGIMTLPAMLLVDERGRVVNRGIHTGEVEEELKKRLTRAAPAAKQPAGGGR